MTVLKIQLLPENAKKHLSNQIQENESGLQQMNNVFTICHYQGKRFSSP